MNKELQQVREALNKLSRLGNEPELGNSTGNVISQQALATLDKVIWEANSVKIGKFTLGDSYTGRKGFHQIFCEDVEGVEFEDKDLEIVLDKFYKDNF